MEWLQNHRPRGGSPEQRGCMISFWRCLLLAGHLPWALLLGGQSPQPACFDTFSGRRAPDRHPMQIQLGTYSNDVPSLVLQSWRALVDCEIAVHEDETCIKRYVTGSFWASENALRFADYLRSRGVEDAQVFAFSHDHVRIVGWGNYLDYGPRYVIAPARE
jgi:hypothetical protein